LQSIYSWPKMLQYSIGILLVAGVGRVGGMVIGIMFKVRVMIMYHV
jgi:hypothetical protein